jgi:hypothetical protein
MCLDTGEYEKGATCARDAVYCGSYAAPKNGAVWYKGKEYRVKSPGGAQGYPMHEHVAITCDKGYKRSKRGDIVRIARTRPCPPLLDRSTLCFLSTLLFHSCPNPEPEIPRNPLITFCAKCV